jgi:hypothetical protein
MEAKVFKLSQTGKTMLVGAKTSKYSVGYTFAWCANPGNAVGDILTDFEPKSTTPVVNENGEFVLHTDGTNVLQWVF